MSNLIRYGLKWNGPQAIVATEMDDGHWTQWHLADKRIDELEAALKLKALGEAGVSDYTGYSHQELAWMCGEQAQKIKELEAKVKELEAIAYNPL